MIFRSAAARRRFTLSRDTSRPTHKAVTCHRTPQMIHYVRHMECGGTTPLFYKPRHVAANPQSGDMSPHSTSKVDQARIKLHFLRSPRSG